MFSRQIKVNIDMTWHHVIGDRRERALSAKDLRRFGSEKCRRKVKLHHGGIDYIAQLLGCDPKTIRQGMQDLEQPEDAAAGRVRKKGGDAGR